MAKKDKTLKVEIKEIHGFLNKKKNKVVVTVSYNDAPPKVNIRSCWFDDDDELHIGSGISLTDEELDTLEELLSDRKHGKLPTISKDGRKAVDFGDIFSSASDIMEKREAGYTTKDGFIRLTKKPGVKLRK